MGQGLDPEWVCPRLASSVWGFHFMQERSHSMHTGDIESKFIKAGHSETKEVFKLEEARGESLGRDALAQ